jgi:Flp pilus assembly protein TadG
MTAKMPRTGVQRPRSRTQRGQSLVEFAISSIVLLLLMMGLLDLSRAFYYAVSLQGAAREGARHGAWFDTKSRLNIYLDNGDIMSAVTSGLQGAGINCTGPNGINCFVPTACLAGADGNTVNNKPYGATNYPAATQTVNVYICYSAPPSAGGGQTGSMPIQPVDNSWRLGDVNVSILMNFGLITPFIQNMFGNGINMAFNEHFIIQGKP